MSEQRASERITEEVTSWSGVAAGPGRRGEFAFKVGSREIGHLHGDQAAHFTFPKPVWKRLFEKGRIDYHPIFPGREGLGARRIETDDDVEDVIALMRLNYERVVEQSRTARARKSPPLSGATPAVANTGCSAGDDRDLVLVPVSSGRAGRPRYSNQ